MANRPQQILEHALDRAIERGFSIIVERNDILMQLADGGLDEPARESLTRRFFDLELQWHMLSATYETKH